jgi:hypothetical protein
VRLIPSDYHTRPGDRVELVRTNDAHTALRPGDRGTVHLVTATDLFGIQVHVQWDSGSTLSLMPGTGDEWRVVK